MSEDRERCNDKCPACGCYTCEFDKGHEKFHAHIFEFGPNDKDGEPEWVLWHMWFRKVKE